MVWTRPKDLWRRGPASRLQAYALVCFTAISTSIAFAAASTTQPSTQPGGDIQSRIDASLRQIGDLDSLAAELLLTQSSDPISLDAGVRVAMEQGDLMAASALATRICAAMPEDAASVTRLARLQELLGKTQAAQQTLAHAIACDADMPRRITAMLRLATLDSETGRHAECAAALRKVASFDAVDALRAGVIAHLLGDEQTSFACLTANGGTTVAQALLAGNEALAIDRLPDAAVAFSQALAGATVESDRLYAQERLIATARRAGKLSQLTNAWLTTPQLPQERFLPLATMLRELGRTADLLAWWQREANRPANGNLLFTRRFVSEIVGSAKSAGASAQAEAIAKDLLKRDPQNVSWLSTVLRMMLDQRKSTEADALLQSNIDAADTSQRLRTLGRLASMLGRDAPALAAARSLIARGGDDAIEGQLQQAAIFMRNGDRDAAVAIFNTAASSGNLSGAAANKIASAMEAAGLGTQAATLLQSACRDRPDNETLEHLAALLIAQHRPVDAIPVLQQLLRSSPTPALHAQTLQQLLDAAVATNTLKALAVELSTRLSDGGGDADDMTLLVDAYGRLKDSKAAIAVLRSTSLLSDTEKLHRIVTVSLQAGEFGEAYDALNRLVSAEPDQAVSTLQQMAVVAIRAKRADAAAAAIEQLKARIGDGSESLALLGSLFSELGQAKDAARCYRRTLAIERNATDDWLLWSQAMEKAGDRSAAVRRLQLLCGDDSASDATRAAAADGLLNLNASPDVLRTARRDLMLQLAVDPGKPLLYPVLADLSEELQDPVFALRVSELAVPMGEGDRSQRIRDLMDVAGEASKTNLSIECGKGLLTLGDNFPPQLFLQLGERLLSANQLDEAQRAFDRSAEMANDEQILPRASELLSRYGYYDAALKRLRPLADRRVGDVEFLHETARLEEIVGQTSAAYDHYCAAFVLVAHQVVAAELAPVTGVVKLDPAREAGGALATARTVERQHAVIQLIETQVDYLLRDAPANASPSPAVTTFLQLLHRACFPIHEIEVADRVDRLVLQRWPTVASLGQMMLSDRIDAGLYAKAASFAAARGIETSESLQQVVLSTQPVPITLPVAMTPQKAAAMLPVLIAQGNMTRARAVLAAVPFDIAPPSTAAAQTRGSPPSPISTLVAAAAAIHDDELATRWAMFWLRSLDAPSIDHSATAPTSGPSTTTNVATQIRQMGKVQQVRRAIATTWRSLSDRGRSQLAGEICAQFERATTAAEKFALADIALRTTSATSGIDHAAGSLAAAECLLGVAAPTPASVSPLFFAVQLDDRPGFLKKALAAVKPDRQLSLLATIVSLANEPLDSATVAAINAAADTIVAPQTLDDSMWFANAAQANVLPTLARTVLRSASGPSTASTDIAGGGAAGAGARHLNRLEAAAAFSTVGDQPQADVLARAVIDSIIEVSRHPNDATTKPAASPALDSVALMRFAVGVLSANARSRLLAEVGDARGNPVDNLPPRQQAVQLLLKSVVLEGIGQRAAALDTLREGFARSPQDASLQRAYADHLVADGRKGEMISALGSHAASVALNIQDGPRPLLDAYRALFRVRELIYHRNENDDSPPLGPDYMTPATRGDKQSTTEVLRVQLERQRATRWFAPGVLQADARGLSATPDDHAALPDSSAALLAGSADDLRAALLARPIRSPFSESRWSSVPRLLAIAARSNPALANDLNATIQTAVASDAVTIADRAVIAERASQLAQPMPPEQLNELWAAAVMDDSGAGFQTLATALRDTHDPAASAVTSWANAAVQVNDLSQDRRISLTPTPVDVNVADGDIAESFRRRLDTSPGSVEAELARLRDAGQLTPALHPRTMMLWARLAAERGDLKVYRTRVDSLLRVLAWRELVPKTRLTLSPMTSIDLREALPLINTAPDAQAACLTIGREALERFAERCPAEPALQRLFAELGDWARSHDQPQAALAMLAEAEHCVKMQGVSESTLCVADLAARLGKHDLAMELERDLLTARCLPALRIAPLLRELNASDSASATRLTIDAATYCSEPNLVAFVNRLLRRED